MRHLLHACALILAFAAGSANAQVHVVLSADGPAYEAVADAVRARLATDGYTSTVGGVDDPVPDPATVIVPVGMLAAERWAGDRQGRAVVATLVPAASWRALDGDAAESRTAVFLDQPVSRHASLARVLLPPARELGIVFGPTSAALAPELQAAASLHSFRMHSVEAATAEAANGAVTRVLRYSEVLLALPDPVVFNRFSVQSILLETFRLRRPVVGFSEAWVQAGALGAVYSTPEQLGREVGEIVAHRLATGEPLPPATFPSDYTVSVNRRVAFSLGLVLPADGVLLQRLRALEGDP